MLKVSKTHNNDVVETRWNRMLAKNNETQIQELKENFEKNINVENIAYQIEASKIAYKLEPNDTYTPTKIILEYLQKHRNVDECLESIKYLLEMCANIKRETKTDTYKNTKMQNVLLAIEAVNGILNNAQFWPQLDVKQTYEYIVEITKMFEEIWVDPKTQKPFEDNMQTTLQEINIDIDGTEVSLEKYIRENTLEMVIDRIFEYTKNYPVEKLFELVANTLDLLSNYEYMQTKNYENCKTDPLLNKILQKIIYILDDPIGYTDQIEKISESCIKVAESIKRFCNVDIMEKITATKGFSQTDEQKMENEIQRYVFEAFSYTDPIQFYIEKILDRAEKIIQKEHDKTLDK